MSQQATRHYHTIFTWNRFHSTSSTKRSKRPFDGLRYAARGSVEAMPHPVRAARPHDTASRTLKLHKEEQKEETEVQKEKNYGSKTNEGRLHLLRAYFDPRPPLGCAPPMLPEKVFAGRYIIQ
jgi:hypothetical protein